jgi:hypothetical protein
LPAEQILLQPNPTVLDHSSQRSPVTRGTVEEGGWRDAAFYRRLVGIDRAGLMWEWLRRDPGYVAWYARASASTRGASGASPLTWGIHFAEDPAIAAPEARLLWHTDLDPGTLLVEAVPAACSHPDAVDPSALAAWLTAVAGPDGREHAVLSDGWHHIRLDVEAGTLSAGPVVLRYRLEGTVSARPKLLSVRRLVEFSLHRRFAHSLYPPDPRIARWLLALQVHDGLGAGASLREIGDAIYGADRVAVDWDGASDSLRSRVRRLAAEGRRLARGGYRALMRRGS